MKRKQVLSGKGDATGLCAVWGLFVSVTSVTFPPSVQLALSSSGEYSEELKRDVGRSEELEDPPVY